LKARTQTREVTDAIRVVVTDSVEPNAATNHLGRKMESEAVNVVEPPQQTAVLAQRNVGTVLQTLAGTVLAIAMIVPLTIIPGLIIAVLPLEIYVLDLS